MNKKIVLSLIFMCLIGVRLNVVADTHSPATSSSDASYNTLYNGYNKGIQKVNVTTNKRITLYGKSACNGTSCTVTYAGALSLEDALAKSVSCTNGEKYIVYQFAGSGNYDYLEDNKAKFSGTAYWDVEYEVTCSSTDTGVNTVTLNNDTSTNTGTENGTNSGTGTGNGNVTNNNSGTGNYGSSTTVDPENTGVNTYFVVLGIVGLLSYMIMLLVKKYNLFKKI